MSAVVGESRSVVAQVRARRLAKSCPVSSRPYVRVVIHALQCWDSLLLEQSHTPPPPRRRREYRPRNSAIELPYVCAILLLLMLTDEAVNGGDLGS